MLLGVGLVIKWLDKGLDFGFGFLWRAVELVPVNFDSFLLQEMVQGAEMAGAHF